MSPRQETGEVEIYEIPASLVVTSGDPAGIGPEVTHKAIKKLQRKKKILTDRPVVVIGDAFQYARHLGKPSAMQSYHIIPMDDYLSDFVYLTDHVAPKPGKPWRPIFLDCGFKDEQAITPGQPSKAAGERANTYLGAAMELMFEDLADSICTAPICKEQMDSEEFPYPGQTEMFADLCDVKTPVMMLVGGGLRVALVTIHEPLAKIPRLLSRKLIREVATITDEALKLDFGIPNPRIAVCGLNPHASENGKFGNEEKKTITPAIKQLQKTDINVVGPLSADTVFHHARQNDYDVVIAMYHDQGLIPVKTLAFHEGVNMTLGLPIVRTAPDHGTAFDIAGQNKANEGAMLQALLLADQTAAHRETQFVGA